MDVTNNTTTTLNNSENNSPLANFGQDVKAASLEFVGTAFFLLIGLGGIQAAASNEGSGVEKTMFVATSMGLSLLTSAWLFYRITGGLFNPNISLALWMIGGISTIRFILYCIAQLAGGVAAAAIVRGLAPGQFLVNVYLQNHTTHVQGVFIEMFITSALVMAVLMLAAEKHEVTPFAPIGIGLTLFACHLFALFYTGAAMNTARAFGPAVVSGFPYPDHWIYWVGPFLGSLLGVITYTFLKHTRYWTINPNQTAVEPEFSPDDPINVIKASVRRNDNGTLGGDAPSMSERAKASTDTREADQIPGASYQGRRHVDQSPV